MQATPTARGLHMKTISMLRSQWLTASLIHQLFYLFHPLFWQVLKTLSVEGVYIEDWSAVEHLTPWPVLSALTVTRCVKRLLQQKLLVTKSSMCIKIFRKQLDSTTVSYNNSKASYDLLKPGFTKNIESSRHEILPVAQAPYPIRKRLVFPCDGSSWLPTWQHLELIKAQVAGHTCEGTFLS